MLKISIVVPVYNSEKTLRSCIESLLNQTLKDIEVVLVNDGSTDESLFICQEYAQKDRRIKLVSKEHGGCASAKNCGLTFVNSDYVGFVSGYDRVDVDFYEKLYNSIIREKCDIAVASVVRQRQLLKNYNEIYKEEIIVESLKDKLKQSNVLKNCNICNKLYKTELVKKNVFNENSIYENMSWLPEIIKHSGKMVFVSNTSYHDNRLEENKFKNLKYQTEYYNAQKDLVKFFDDNEVKLTEQEKTVTSKTISLFNKFTLLKVNELNYTKFYYLFGFILLFRVVKYPEIEVYHG